jgi:hypothetical protein
VDTRQGALVVIIDSKDNNLIEETAFLTPDQGGSLRIVKADGEKLTLIAEFGVVYVFDVSTMQFISLPPGSKEENITVLPLITISSPSGILLGNTATPTPSKTPTRTPTIRPTRTALPTFNPYP